MQATVTVYFNTGFNGVDIPADATVLETAQNKVYPDYYYIREDLDCPIIRIKDTYENLCNVDYVKIVTTNTTSYFFAVPSAISKGVTALSLDLDALLTMGGAKNLNYSSGWQERGHIAKADDGLFSNTASEPWEPSNPLEAVNLTMIKSNKSEITGQDTGDTRDIIVTNIDFKSLAELPENEMEVISLMSNGTAVSDIPMINTPDYGGSTFFGVWDSDEIDPEDPTIQGVSKNFKTPGTAAYDLRNKNVNAALTKLFSAGQLQLQASYRIPWEYVDELLTQMEKSGQTYNPETDSGLYLRIHGYHQVYNANNLPYEYQVQGYTVKNKKVFESYRSYVIVNLGSGDMSIKKAYDVYNPQSQAAAPAVLIWADPTSTGKPYARFQYIKDNPLQWSDTVKGLQWANAQISMEGASGSLWNSINAAFTNQTLQRSQQELDINQEYARANMGASMESNAINYLSGVRSRGYQNEDLMVQAGLNMVSDTSAFAKAHGKADLAKMTDSTAKMYGHLWNTYNSGRQLDLQSETAQQLRNVQMQQEMAGAKHSGEIYGINEAKIRQAINENQVGLYKNNSVVAPTIMFTPEQNLGLYGYNRFAIYEVRKSKEDLISEDQFYQRFGYSGLHRPLTAQCFNERPYYSYVQAFNINIKSNFGMRIRQKAITQLNSGVRVWKVLPDASYYETN